MEGKDVFYNSTQQMSLYFKITMLRNYISKISNYRTSIYPIIEESQSTTFVWQSYFSFYSSIGKGSAENILLGISINYDMSG